MNKLINYFQSILTPVIGVPERRRLTDGDLA